MARSKQLTLRFPQEGLSFDEMAITDANRSAVTAARRPEQWPYHVFCVIGPKKSGLTTLAGAWAREQGARFYSHKAFASLAATELEAIAGAPVVIDRADKVADERHLLGLISHAKRLGGRILLTARRSPSQWTSKSPDLASRLRSAPLVELQAPDEEMMRARLHRAAREAYLKLPPAVEDYLVTRLGLSYERIDQAVQELAGAVGGRELTVALARDCLNETGGEGAN